MVAPIAAVGGGGLVTGVGRYFYEKEANDGECAMVDAEINQLQPRLDFIKTCIQDKELNVAKLKYLLERCENHW